jgi:hypothetical protein
MQPPVQERRSSRNEGMAAPEESGAVDGSPPAKLPIERSGR